MKTDPRPAVPFAILCAMLCAVFALGAGAQTFQWIQVGTANSATGDTRYVAFNKVNTNFSLLFTNVLPPLTTNLDQTLVTTTNTLTNWLAWTPGTSTVVLVTATVTAGTTNDGGAGLSTWELEQTFKVNAAGTTVTAATNNPTRYRQLDAFASPWTAHLTNFGSTNIGLAVLGATGTNVAWRARVQALSRRLIP